MKKACWSWCLLAALSSCSDGQPAADGDSCHDDAACACPDGRKGSTLCDLDTHAFVMCDCPVRTERADQSTDVDAGPDAAADSGDSRADAGQSVAADGGGSGAAGRAGGAAGEGAAGHPGKALGHAKARGPKH
jgi:hypothetical protein